MGLFKRFVAAHLYQLEWTVRRSVLDINNYMNINININIYIYRERERQRQRERERERRRETTILNLIKSNYILYYII